MIAKARGVYVACKGPDYVLLDAEEFPCWHYNYSFLLNQDRNNRLFHCGKRDAI